MVLGQKFLDMFKKIVVAIHPEYNTIFFTVTYYKSSCRMTWIIGKLVSATFSVLSPMCGTSIHIFHLFPPGDQFLG
jgi:hypothetical protein